MYFLTVKHIQFYVVLQTFYLPGMWFLTTRIYSLFRKLYH